MDHDFIIDDNCHHSMNSLMGLQSRPYEDDDSIQLKNQYRGNNNSILEKLQNDQSDNIDRLDQNEQRAMCEKYQKKLIRNRESAKNSRKRKKIYVDLLEDKVNKLTKIHQNYLRVNQSCQQTLSDMRQKLTLAQEQNNQRTLQFSSLHNAVLTSTQESKINQLLEQMNKKFGSATNEKLQRVHHFASEIQENCMADYEQYLLKCAHNEMDIFSNDKDELEYRIIQNLNLTQKQQDMILKQKQKLQNSFVQLNNSNDTIKKTEQMIIAEMHLYEQTMRQFKHEVNPSQLAKFIIHCEQMDQRNEFKAAFESNFGLDDENIQEESPLETYQFIKEFQLIDNLELSVKANQKLYQEADDTIQKKMLRAIKKE